MKPLSRLSLLLVLLGTFALAHNNRPAPLRAFDPYERLRKDYNRENWL